ncbi:MAG: alpha-galactosidase [Oscillospiraceae bacterium]|nr:alpha-galactosidase [Oscillospiraceae bacterium]
MMDFELIYSLNGERHTVSSTDENVEIKADSGKRTTVTVTAKVPITLLSATITMPYSYRKNEPIFVNGYQSWTDTKEFLAGESLKDIRKLPKFLVNAFAFDGYGDSGFKDYKKGVLHGYDISYAENIFIGSFNYHEAYLIINHDVKSNQIILESDVAGLKLEGSICLFDFTTDRDYYFSKFPEKPIRNILGYTSWYNYYENINEEKILANLSAVGEPFELFQIDDGYETAVGDWMSVDSEKFPNGLEPIVKKIHEKGLKAGIWLAPFAAESESEVYKAHPDWFFSYRSGSNWSGFYGLDSENEEAMKYVEKCLKFYSDMGFDFFKLDFLYAVNPRIIGSKTRAQISSEAYSRIRKALPDKLILGCGGMILISECFDYLRIGPDVSLKFDDVWYMKFMHRERISTKVTIQNTIYRSFLDKRFFGCDPDVFILRDDNNSLTDKQKEALITINALFGSVMMTSDNVGDYDNEKKTLFEKALNLRNATDKSYCRVGDFVEISYKLEGKTHNLKYDTKRGILYER